MKPNLASRAAHWSATHRKTAIFGWLGFVVFAFMVGNLVGQNMIHGADRFSGESGDAEQALEDSGLRPNDEIGDGPGREARRSRTGVPDRDRATDRRLSGTDDVIKVRSPLTGDAAGSAGPAFGPGRVRDHGKRARGGGPARAEPGHRRLGQAASPDCASSSSAASAPKKELNEHLRVRPGQGRDALAADHLADPGGRIRLAGRGGRAAAARRSPRVVATMALVAIPSQIFPVTATSRR